MTDDGSQFRSNNEEFNEFARKWGFKRTISSPYHHQGNGKAEAAVKIVKRIFKKADRCNQDRWLALLEWRNTTNSIKSSPAQRLFSRRLRTSIPMKAKKLEPQLQTRIKDERIASKRRSKYHHDKSAKSMPDIEEGEDVFVQLRPDQNSKWSKAKITRRKSGRKFAVEKDGREYVRNRQHIRKFATITFDEPEVEPQAEHPERGGETEEGNQPDDDDDQQRQGGPEDDSSSASESYESAQVRSRSDGKAAEAARVSTRHQRRQTSDT